MKPKIVHARDKKVMDQLMELFIESKYKIQSSDWNYVLKLLWKLLHPYCFSNHSIGS